MFIEIKNKEQLISELSKRTNKSPTIHYICTECDDEQVTGEIDIENYIIEQLQDEDCIYTFLPCTNCGSTMKFLQSDYVIGIED